MRSPQPPPEWSWLPDYSTVETLSDVFLHVSAPAQTLFVVLWAVLPWWREWIGRALMIKSFALMLFLNFALLVHYAGPAWWQPYLSAALFGLVTVGIVSQVVALPYEMVRASLDRRKVRGTARHGRDTPTDADERESSALR